MSKLSFSQSTTLQRLQARCLAFHPLGFDDRPAGTATLRGKPRGRGRGARARQARQKQLQKAVREPIGEDFQRRKQPSSDVEDSEASGGGFTDGLGLFGAEDMASSARTDAAAGSTDVPITTGNPHFPFAAGTASEAGASGSARAAHEAERQAADRARLDATAARKGEEAQGGADGRQGNSLAEEGRGSGGGAADTSQGGVAATGEGTPQSTAVGEDQLGNPVPAMGAADSGGKVLPGHVAGGSAEQAGLSAADGVKEVRPADMDPSERPEGGLQHGKADLGVKERPGEGGENLDGTSTPGVAGQPGEAGQQQQEGEQLLGGTEPGDVAPRVQSTDQPSLAAVGELEQDLVLVTDGDPSGQVASPGPGGGTDEAGVAASGGSTEQPAGQSPGAAGDQGTDPRPREESEVQADVVPTKSKPEPENKQAAAEQLQEPVVGVEIWSPVRKANNERAVERARWLEMGDPEGVRVKEREKEAQEARARMDRQQQAALAEVQAAHAYTGNPADYKLDKSLVEKVAQDNTVMVTWANLHYLDFVLNWVAHVRGVGIHSYLVGAMDNDILKELVDRGINTFAMASGLSLEDFGWGSPTFHKMGRVKIDLIRSFTRMGFHIFVSDVDTIWLKNPYPFIARYPDADILTTSDTVWETSPDVQLDDFRAVGYLPNIGVMLVRATAVQLAEEWSKVLEEDDKIWDQHAFQKLYTRGAAPTDRSDRLFRGYDGKLLMGMLPISTFGSGHTFFTQRMNERLGLDVYVVHATFQFSGTPGKRHRMRERLLWAPDPPEYYDPVGGLLSFTLQFNGLLSKAGPTSANVKSLAGKRGHFDLVNFELLQIRNALAIASILNRTLVMPELYCGMDRYWAPHDGVLPGSFFGVPFLCPLDHIMDLEEMHKNLSQETHGPSIRFRESSFLDNPRTPPAVRDDQLRIHICQGRGQMHVSVEVFVGAKTAGASGWQWLEGLPESFACYSVVQELFTSIVPDAKLGPVLLRELAG
eukprot:jgi/Botrbrau1/20711/Bobra.0058s0040.1